MDITKRLKLIQEGFLFEAENDNQYDLPTNVDTSSDDNSDNQPQTSDTNSDAPVTSDQAGQTDDNTQTDDSTNTDSESDDPTDSNGDGSDSDDQTSSDDDNSDDAPKEGEILQISERTRSILLYKNFSKYRALRDSVDRLCGEFAEIQTISDNIRSHINEAINRANDLLQKLNDYIQFKYSDESYETNYRNYIQFLLEKTLILQIYENIVRDSKVKNENK